MLTLLLYANMIPRQHDVFALGNSTVNCKECVRAHISHAVINGNDGIIRRD